MDRNQRFLKNFLKHESALKAFVGALVRDPAQREDLFQEIALTLCEKYDRFDEDRSFPAWARGVAKNKILRMWERARHEKAIFSTRSIDAIDRAFGEIEPVTEPLQDALSQCLDKLPGRSRHLLALRYEASFKLHEIAEKMGKTLSAAHKALTRIREVLAHCLERRLAEKRRTV